jgi:orotate phosphoribosyltransferase
MLDLCLKGYLVFVHKVGYFMNRPCLVRPFLWQYRFKKGKEFSMEKNVLSISLTKNPIISIKVIPGHFTTSNAHSNCYLDVSDLKTDALVARDVARELAIPYLSSTLIDTIVCMEKTEVIGAYLAEELLQEGTSVMNAGGKIHVVSPTYNTNGNLVFPDNVIEWILNRNILLLVASISSGRTVAAAMECLAYYGGKIAGISTLFLTSGENLKQEVHPLFTSGDIPGYKLFGIGDCELCKTGQKLDAIISSEGYTILQGG